MTEPRRIFAIGDEHGELGHHERLIDCVMKNADFDYAAGDMWLSLGDKNDRGANSYRIFEWWKNEMDRFSSPGDLERGTNHVVCLLGNHERMMINAAKDPHGPAMALFEMNGGYKTMASYGETQGMYGYRCTTNFRGALEATGHWHFLTHDHLLFFETPDFFFSHAPIPLPGKLYQKHPHVPEIRVNEEILTWSYYGENTEDWVRPDIDGKIAVSGHIHGMEYNPRSGEIKVPGIRRHGDAFLIDTGCGCAKVGYLTALELPALKAYNSKGEVTQL